MPVKRHRLRSYASTQQTFEIHAEDLQHNLHKMQPGIQETGRFALYPRDSLIIRRAGIAVLKYY